MKLSSIGEFGLIQRMASRMHQSLPIGIEGIGDDCALIPTGDNSSWLITTDMLIEDIHFLKSKISAKDLGYKALAVNLSDIAAMGGIPLYFFLSLGLPIELEVGWFDKFFNGLQELAQETQIFLLGGDTSHSYHSLMINITMIGSCLNENIKRRSAAQPGDIVCCTDYLGESGAGLKVITKNLPITTSTKLFLAKHHRPRPHLKEAQWLAKYPAVHAMIDLSDGLDSDIRHIMEQSYCGARIDCEALPISSTLLQAAHEFGWNAQELAATAGEDYCLLLTVDPTQYENLNKAYQQEFHNSLFKIGVITSTPLELLYIRDRNRVSFSQKGYEHFK